ncbi:MAG: nuclear transport factor 2 family protein [Spirosomataceae bacterium]
MKQLLTIITLFFGHLLYAQNADETAVKQVIEGQTKASYDKNLDKILSYWADVPEAGFTITSMNANIRGYNNVKLAYTNFVKNDPKPDNTKIETVYHSIRINGNSAWVSHDEIHHRTNGTVGKNNCSRYLEKINGEWKLVSYVTTPAPIEQQTEIEAIKKVIKDETDAYFEGNADKLLAQWSDKPYNEHQTQFLVPFIGNSFAKGKAFDQLMEVARQKAYPEKVQMGTSDYDVHIAGTTAWVTYSQEVIKENKAPMKGREIRILERINGMWKIVLASEQAAK